MSFGQQLRQIRAEQHISQLCLAGRAGVSQRHISFLECGKSRPSRGMVVHLGRCLSLGPRRQNDLLLAAGFAPAFAEPGLDDPSLAQARQAIEFLLERNEPCPAIALDADWKVLAGNRGLSAMMGFLLTGDPHGALPIEGLDYLAGMTSREGVSRYLVDAERIACTTLEQVQREALASGNEALHARATQLLSRYDRPAIHDCVRPPSLVPTVEFRREGTCLRFMTIMTAFATPCAVDLAAIRLEVFYPADQTTRELLERFQSEQPRAQPAPAPAITALGTW